MFVPPALTHASYNSHVRWNKAGKIKAIRNRALGHNVFFMMITPGSYKIFNRLKKYRIKSETFVSTVIIG